MRGVFCQLLYAGRILRSHVFPEGPANLWITMVPGRVHTDTDPIRLVTAEDLRYQYCHIKTLNLIPNVLASQKAREAGCQEAVFVRPGGIVTECAHSNIHFLKDGVLYIHPADQMILPGIARAHLLKACRAAGIPVREEAFTLQELLHADEVIVTSSSFPCIRAGEVDGRAAGMRDAESFYRLHRILTREALQAAA